ncbi:hypothetical protein OKW21_003197 [Catalinimonas alkaloidigena]|uniref:DUF5367 family protein n=1 Tax=Catalinimonas alkaloidigena TaxID=1075417 RepID=UPI002404F697|nr:DUF5367 family protein [Catalinimonas alkaloidigena]MDF9797934.1 hypothetical protein [Catalinimonas alkaloidigena]
MNIKRLVVSAAISWVLGVSAYAASFMLNILDDAELQANLVLMLALLPSVIIAIRFYFNKANPVNGFVLGLSMFGIAMLLDALITVPVFIIPMGGSYLTFFSDPGFWMIALEYILVVVLYTNWRQRMAVQ